MYNPRLFVLSENRCIYQISLRSLNPCLLHTPITYHTNSLSTSLQSSTTLASVAGGTRAVLHCLVTKVAAEASCSFGIMELAQKAGEVGVG